MSYKRFTERRGEEVITNCKECEYDKEHSMICTEYHCIDALKNRLAELEDKIENKTLIELPCKVGDTVWEIFYSKYEERILELEVTQIVMLEKISYRCKTKTRCLYSYGWVKNEDFGKTVFLTKAEAEKKLKELQRND